MCVCRSLSKVQFDFQSLAETTIIMLHLEVRCHCFYHLLPAVRKVRWEAGGGRGGEGGRGGMF